MGADFVAHLLELDRGTFTLLNDQVIDDARGIHVRADGIWQVRFAEDVIRHYSRNLALIEDVSVASSFPGFPGPVALTSSFSGGFFLVDLFGSRLVEVDSAGHQIAEASTAMLAPPLGRGLAIDVDRATRRIFLQVENSAIYVLSDDFIQPARTIVTIDVKPGSVPNSINPKSQGVTPVAILTTATFDPRWWIRRVSGSGRTKRRRPRAMSRMSMGTATSIGSSTSAPKRPAFSAAIARSR